MESQIRKGEWDSIGLYIGLISPALHDLKCIIPLIPLEPWYCNIPWPCMFLSQQCFFFPVGLEQ